MALTPTPLSQQYPQFGQMFSNPYTGTAAAGMAATAQNQVNKIKNGSQFGGYGYQGGAQGGSNPGAMPARDVNNLTNVINQPATGQANAGWQTNQVNQMMQPTFGSNTQMRTQFNQFANPGDYGAQQMFNPYTQGGFAGDSAMLGVQRRLNNDPQSAQMNRFLNTQAVDINPVIEQLRKDYTTQLQESVLPGLRSGAVASGQYGGSRQAIAEGLANAKANDAFQREAAGMRYQNALNALDRQMQASQFADTMGQQGLIAGGQMAAQRGQMDMANRAQQMQALQNILGARQAGQQQGIQVGQTKADIYNQERSRELAARQAAAQLQQQGLDRALNESQFSRNLSANAAQQLADIASQYYGYNQQAETGILGALSGASSAQAGAAASRDIAKMRLPYDAMDSWTNYQNMVNRAQGLY